MTSGPNDDKLDSIMVTFYVLTWTIKTGSMHMLLLLFDDKAKHVVWWHLKHGCLMAPWTTLVQRIYIDDEVKDLGIFLYKHKQDNLISLYKSTSSQFKLKNVYEEVGSRI